MDFISYLNAFWVGGIICLIAQILIDKTKLTPARILVIYVVLGVVLSALGIYEPIVKFAKSGATVPLTGFGYVMANGVKEMIKEKGFVGVFAGGLASSSAGISVAVLCGYLSALLAKSGDKN